MLCNIKYKIQISSPCHIFVTNILFPFQAYNNFIEVIKRKILQNSAAE
jgi:hypothetical protein